ncbi:MAG: hypothetical protein IJA97_01460 [Clostridia bacterium]|nr:hypothetical protein [Clostridia bacterium]
MSGVDGAVKLNSLHAPSVNTETEKPVSAFAVEKTVEEFVKELIERPVEEFIKEEQSAEQTNNELDEPIEEIPDIEVAHNEPIEVAPKEPDILIEPEVYVPDVSMLNEPIETPKVKRGKKIDLKAEFSKVKDIVFNMYEKVFSKTPSFKPTFEQTVGDLLLYISKKLSFKNADGEFNLALGIASVSIPDKYAKGYIPLALKLAKWCCDNGVLNVSEDLLFSISSVYLSSAKAVGVTITELEIAIDFEDEINFAL